MHRFRATKSHFVPVATAAVAVALLAGSFSPAIAAESDWQIGLASANITPTEPIRMAGYSSRKQLSEGVVADLHAKAMAVASADGQLGLIITADIIGFRGAVAEALCKRIIAKTGLARRQILLCPSHTHTGPVLALPEFNDYGLEGDHRQRSLDYTQRLFDQLVELSAAAIGDMKPARLYWSTGKADFVMNRREFTDQGIKLGANRDKHIDDVVPVLRIDSSGGKPRAIVFGCACHNTTLTGKHLELCGDYAGFAQAAVEEQLPGVQAMFIIGCGGAANPFPRGTVEAAQRNGRSLAAEVVRVASGEMRPVRGPLRVDLDRARLPLQNVPREKLEEMLKGPGYLKYNAERMLADLDEGKLLLTEYRAPIALWQFGDDLTLVGLSGEVVSDFVPMIGRAIGPDGLWIAAYTNDSFGYLPSAKILSEGGYETRGLIPEAGFFSAAAEKVAVAKVREMAEKAGRKLPLPE